MNLKLCGSSTCTIYWLWWQPSSFPSLSARSLVRSLHFTKAAQLSHRPWLCGFAIFTVNANPSKPFYRNCPPTSSIVFVCVPVSVVGGEGLWSNQPLGLELYSRSISFSLWWLYVIGFFQIFFFFAIFPQQQYSKAMVVWLVGWQIFSSLFDAVGWKKIENVILFLHRP